MKIDVIEGAAAAGLLREQSFQSQWAELASNCPWGTPFQGSGFVAAWYRTYASRFQPLLVTGREDAGLVGLLPLAIDRASGRVSAAGTWHAEYQTWLATPERGEEFGWQALDAVRRRRRRIGSLRLGYLPPGTPLGWMDSPEAQRVCRVEAHPRPLLRFGDGQAIERFSNAATRGRPSNGWSASAARCAWSA
jgi:hypothetical protein